MRSIATNAVDLDVVAPVSAANGWATGVALALVVAFDCLRAKRVVLAH